MKRPPAELIATARAHLDAGDADGYRDALLAALRAVRYHARQVVALDKRLSKRGIGPPGPEHRAPVVCIPAAAMCDAGLAMIGLAPVEMLLTDQNSRDLPDSLAAMEASLADFEATMRDMERSAQLRAN